MRLFGISFSNGSKGKDKRTNNNLQVTTLLLKGS